MKKRRFLKKLVTTVMGVVYLVSSLYVTFEKNVIEAEAATTTTVYYGFTRISSGFSNGTTYLFVPSEVSSASCLTSLPTGSALLTATSTSNGSSSHASGYSLSTYVTVHTAGDGFDDCTSGGLFDSATRYYCKAGGASNVRGYTYTYKSKTLTASMLSATLAGGTNISSTGPTTLSKSNIIMKVKPETNGTSYTVSDYTLTDAVVNPLTGDNVITAKFGTESINIYVMFTPQAADFTYTAPENCDITTPHDIAAGVTSKRSGMGNITAVKYFNSDNEEVSNPTEPGKYSVKVSTAQGSMYLATTNLTVGTFVLYKEATSVGGTVTWDYNYSYEDISDNNESKNSVLPDDGNRAKYAKVGLYRNGILIDTQVINHTTTDVTHREGYSFTGLRDVDTNGDAYTYTVKVSPMLSETENVGKNYIVTSSQVTTDYIFNYDEKISYAPGDNCFDAEWKVTVAGLPEVWEESVDTGEEEENHIVSKVTKVPSAIYVKLLYATKQDADESEYSIISQQNSENDLGMKCLVSDNGDGTYSYEGQYPVWKYQSDAAMSTYYFRIQVTGYILDNIYYNVSDEEYISLLDDEHVMCFDKEEDKADKVITYDMEDGLKMPLLIVDQNGGEGSVHSIINPNFDGTVDVDGLPVPKKPEYRFTGWTDAVTGDTVEGIINLEDITVIKASWEEIPAPAEIVCKEETVKNKKDGSISGITEAMEYSLDGGETWRDGNGTIIAGLSNEDVRIRRKETERDSYGKEFKYQFTASTKLLTVKFNNANVKAVAVAYAGLISKPEVEKDGYVFGGWYKDAELAKAWNFENDKVTDNMVLYAKWIEKEKDTSKLVGEVKEGNEKKPNAVVELVLGDKVVASTKTDEDGKYTFDYVESGDYNIIITTEEGKKKTVKATVKEEEKTEVELTLPAANISSEIKYEEEAPKAVVGGLDKLAESKELSENAKYNVLFTVKKIIEDSNELTADQKKINGEIKNGTDNTCYEFVDLSIYTELITEEGTENGRITDTQGKVLEIIVPYDVSGKENIQVLRYHDDRVNTFTELKTKPDESEYKDATYYIGEDYIIFYTTKFSTYAITYTYKINIDDTEHGTLILSPESPVEGDRVTVKPVPETGYILKILEVLDAAGNKLEVTDNGDGTFSYIQIAGEVYIHAEYMLEEAPQTDIYDYSVMLMTVMLLAALVVLGTSKKRKRI